MKQVKTQVKLRLITNRTSVTQNDLSEQERLIAITAGKLSDAIKLHQILTYIQIPLLMYSAVNFKIN